MKAHAHTLLLISLFPRNSAKNFNSRIYILINFLPFEGCQLLLLAIFFKTCDISDSVGASANGSFEATVSPKPIIALWLGITACLIQSVTIRKYSSFTPIYPIICVIDI